MNMLAGNGLLRRRPALAANMRGMPGVGAMRRMAVTDVAGVSPMSCVRSMCIVRGAVMGRRAVIMSDVPPAMAITVVICSACHPVVAGVSSVPMRAAKRLMSGVTGQCSVSGMSAMVRIGDVTVMGAVMTDMALMVVVVVMIFENSACQG